MEGKQAFCGVVTFPELDKTENKTLSVVQCLIAGGLKLGSVEEKNAVLSSDTCRRLVYR
jgi:hypothetical protein